MVDLDDVKDKVGSDSGVESKTGGKETMDSPDVKKRKNTKTSGGKTNGIKRLVFCIANMNIASRKLDEFVGDVSPKKKQVIEGFSSDLSGKVIEFAGAFNLEEILDKTDSSFDDTMEHILDKKDKSGDGFEMDTSSCSKSDVEDLLKCIGNIFLYVEGHNRIDEYQDEVSAKNEIKSVAANVLQGVFEDYISLLGVQKIAERNGYDWEEDIIKGILSDQNMKEIVGIES